MADAHDLFAATRARAAHESFGERLKKQEASILSNLVSKYRSKEKTLTGEEALIGIGVISELRKIEKALERDVINAIEDLENE